MGACQCTPSKSVKDPKSNGASKKEHKLKKSKSRNNLATIEEIEYTPDNEYVEAIVCQEHELLENEIKSFPLGDGKVLVIKQDGVISAIGSKCPHYGVPLAGSVLGKNRVRCPLHGACFNVKTGDIEDYPTVDALPCFEVKIVNGNVVVRGRKTEVETSKRTKPMVRKNPLESNVYVIIGGGPSGGICAESLRQEGYTGKIIMVCKEKYLPYDRVKVSKSINFDISKAEFRTAEWYELNGIDVIRENPATSVNTSDKKITLRSDLVLNYTKCFIATGSNPRLPNIPGKELKNIFTMVNYDDSMGVLDLLKPDKHVVVYGTSFIGLESAASCVSKVAKVTVIGRSAVPLKATFGEQIGKRFMDLFKEKGVDFIMNSGIKRFIGTDGVITAVELNDGSELKADLCIVGIGSNLFTDFLKDSGIEIRSDGSIPVNKYMETNVRGVFAGGDIAYAPVYSNNMEPAVIGHYPLAHYHGKIAALNMIGKVTEVRAIPFFWTVLFGKSIRYAGYGDPDEIKIEGDLEQIKFFAFHFKGDKVIGMSSCNRDPIVAQYAEYLYQGNHLTKEQVLKDPLGWTKTLNQ
ncbi:apoptosis-inducing factor 3-like [Chrysoperla carnea]|uniref:apoptosis-inducing factor 3-like n=1 Tax=Chrysoperla carnea TaxID=189513 RepID=UPI001D073B25|nr:apoptosis-inducing factor 3-like [Chrysoperla carnea]